MKSLTSLNKGNAIVLILSILGILAIFTGAIGVGAVRNLRGMAQGTEDDQSRFIARAGIEAALARLSLVRKWPTSAAPKSEGSCWSVADYNYVRDHLGLWSTTSPNLHADVTVYNNTAGAFHRSTVGPDGTAIPEGYILIISSGIADIGGTARRSTTVAALAKPVGVTFDKAAFGASEVSVLDTLVDTVDSSVLGWTPASYTPYDLSTNPLGGATIASNNNALDTIVFNAGSQVDGDVLSGPSSPLGAIAYHGATFTGTDGTLSSAKDTSTLLPPPAAVVLGGGGDVDYGSGAWSLPGETYHIQGDFNLTAGADLTFTGPTTLFIDGNLNASGASLNMLGKPEDLQIYMTGTNDGTSTTVDITNNSQVSLLVSGPDATANVTDSEVFGSVMADRVNLNNSELHCDVAVANLQLGSSNWTTATFLYGATVQTAVITPPAGGPPTDPFIGSGGSGTSGSGTSGSGTSGSGTSGSGTSGSGTSGSGTSGSGTSGSGTSGSGTSGSGTSGSGTSGVVFVPRCCLDFSCGPPMCELL